MLDMKISLGCMFMVLGVFLRFLNTNLVCRPIKFSLPELLGVEGVCVLLNLLLYCFGGLVGGFIVYGFNLFALCFYLLFEGHKVIYRGLGFGFGIWIWNMGYGVWGLDLDLDLELNLGYGI